MAKQVSGNGYLQFLDGDDEAKFEFSLSGNTARYYYHDFTVTTTEEQLDIEDLAAIDWVCLRNLDDTNYVEIGPATTVYSNKLRTGEATGPIKWNETAVMFARANTATIKLRALLIDILT